jgi:hypothetical protein
LDLGGTCILNSDCNQGLVCTWGFCHVACHTSADCQPGQSCIMAGAQSTACESPTSCIYNSNCPTGLICAVDQQCRKQCQTSADCTSGQTCTTTQTCAELSQVDSNKNLFLPDGGVSGSGGASGAGGSGVTGTSGFTATGGAIGVGETTPTGGTLGAGGTGTGGVTTGGAGGLATGGATTDGTGGTATGGSAGSQLVDAEIVADATSPGDGGIDVPFSPDISLTLDLGTGGSDGPGTGGTGGTGGASTGGAGTGSPGTGGAGTGDAGTGGASPDTVIATYPTNPTTSAAGDFTFTSPQSGITFECSLDGVLPFTSCAAAYTTPALTNGTHVIYVRARDAGGNVDTTPASYTWTVAA